MSIPITPLQHSNPQTYQAQDHQLLYGEQKYLLINTRPFVNSSLLPSAFSLTPPTSQSQEEEIVQLVQSQSQFHNSSTGSFQGLPTPATPANTGSRLLEGKDQRFIDPPPVFYATSDSSATSSDNSKDRHVLESIETPNKVPQESSLTITAPDGNPTSFQTPISNIKAYNGYLQRQKKDSADESGTVWNAEVEKAFMEALRKIPRVGRRKITVHGRPCGRNELISDFIFKKTGKLRSRKQVSSHIQVLKGLLKEDDEFMKLVAGNQLGEPDKIPPISPIFSKNSAGAREQEESRSQIASEMFHTSPEMSLLPGTTSVSTPCPPRPSTAALGTNLTTFDSPPFVNNQSIRPVFFSMWRESEAGSDIFTQLIRPQLETPLKMKNFHNIADRFPSVSDLVYSGKVSCPVIYGKVKFHLSRTKSKNGQTGSIPEEGMFKTDLQFLVNSPSKGYESSSPRHYRWDCATNISTMGHHVLELWEPVNSQVRLYDNSEKIDMPFANDFWAAFIAGLYSNGGDTATGQNDAQSAINAITVTQKLYCRIIEDPNEPLRTIPYTEQENLNDMCAIIIWEFDKVSDNFAARTVFRRLYGTDLANDQAQQFNQAFNSSPLAAKIETRVFGPRHSVSVASYEQAQNDLPMSAPMMRSFSTADAGIPPEIHNPYGQHSVYSLPESVEPLGISRPMTAFAPGPGSMMFANQSSAIISSDTNWYSRSAVNNGAIDMNYNEELSQGQPATVINHPQLQIDVGGYAFIEPPLRSAPPTVSDWKNCEDLNGNGFQVKQEPLTSTYYDEPTI